VTPAIHSIRWLRALSRFAWFTRQAVRARLFPAGPALERRVPGWLQVLPAARRSDARLARLWIYGVPVWEFEIRATHPVSDGGMVSAEIEFLSHSVLSAAVHTSRGRVEPWSEPHLV
jgi:hypothetical protein